MERPELGPGVDAEPLGEVRAVGLVAVEGSGYAVHAGHSTEQGDQHLVVGFGALEER